MMSKTTFATFQKIGPWPKGKTRVDMSVYLHRSGVWSVEALERLGRRDGMVLIRAYWMYYNPRYGYAGASLNPIYSE